MAKRTAAKARASKSTQGTRNQLRIIGGEWRGRKIPFADLPGLRPTPDRIRETLFNWLMADIAGARCLDLYAGSGALGLEALSRGAARVDMVDNTEAVAEQLQQNLQTLNAQNAYVWSSDAARWLSELGDSHQHRFDIIFLDPPYRKQLIETCIATIDKQSLLAANGWLYLEQGTDEAPPMLPAGWSLFREKVAGQVCSRLIKAN